MADRGAAEPGRAAIETGRTDGVAIRADEGTAIRAWALMGRLPPDLGIGGRASAVFGALRVHSWRGGGIILVSLWAS